MRTWSLVMNLLRQVKTCPAALALIPDQGVELPYQLGGEPEGHADQGAVPRCVAAAWRGATERCLRGLRAPGHWRARFAQQVSFFCGRAAHSARSPAVKAEVACARHNAQARAQFWALETGAGNKHCVRRFALLRRRRRYGLRALLNCPGPVQATRVAGHSDRSTAERVNSMRWSPLRIFLSISASARSSFVVPHRAVSNAGSSFSFWLYNAQAMPFARDRCDSASIGDRLRFMFNVITTNRLLQRPPDTAVSRRSKGNFNYSILNS